MSATLLPTTAALFARNLTGILTHRAWVLLLQLGGITPPVVSLLVWTGAMARGATPPVPPDQVVTWFVLVALISMLTSSWTSVFLAEDIRTGALSIWLVRPGSPVLPLVTNNVAEKAVKSLVMVPLVAILTAFFHSQVQLPRDPGVWAPALLALACAAVLTFTVDVLIGCLAFWFEDVGGFAGLVGLAQRLLSGAVVPLMLLPVAVQEAVRFQPFRFTLAFPLEVLTTPERVAAADWWAMGAWSVGAVLVACVVWRRGLRRYEAAGA